MTKPIIPRRKRSLIWILPEENFKTLVRESDSYKTLLEKLGFKNLDAGNSFHKVKRRIEVLDLNIDHFMGQGGWQKLNNTIDPNLVLIKESPYRPTVCKNAFKRFKCVAYVCKECGHGPEWRGKPLVLTFDHINGDKKDNRPTNLRWLCPMCNSQTDTFAGRNKRLKRLQREKENIPE